MHRLKATVIVRTLFLAGALSLFFLLWRKNFVALGILVGAFTGIICFQLLAAHISKSPSLSLERIKPYFFLKYLARYGIMGITLFVCAKVELNLFLGASAGLLLINLIIFLGVLRNAKYRTNSY